MIEQMPRRGRVGIAVLLSMASMLGACADGDPTATSAEVTTTIAPAMEPFVNPGQPASIRLTLPVLDMGVVTDVEMIDQRTLTGYEVVADGLTLDMSSCEQRAPGQWVVEGEASLPPGVSSATAEIGVSWLLDDTADGVMARVEIDGAGPFAIPVDVFAFRRLRAERNGQRPDFADAATTEGFDDGSPCELDIGSADVPIGEQTRSTVDPTRSATPLRWEAPEGSAQALGIGAELSDPDDGRIAFAYLTWMAMPLPFDEVVVPTDPSAMAVRELGASNPDAGARCGSFTINGDGFAVTQTDGCQGAPEDYEEGGKAFAVDGPVDGVEGFSWIDGPNVTRAISGRLGEYYVYLYGDGGPDRLTEIAAGLRLAANISS